MVTNIKRIALIFGISGQDGAYLAKFLIEKGYEVHGTSRVADTKYFSSLKQLGIAKNIKLHTAALNDFRNTLKVIEKVSPHEIYNLSGQSSVGLSFEQPVETLESITTATINILESIRFLGGKFLFYNASSSECFGDTKGLAAKEDTTFNPKSPYGIAKASAFWLVAQYRDSYDLFACSGILFNHESCLRPSRFVTRKISKTAAKIALGSNEKLYLGNISIKRDWGWAPEYVEAMWKMLQQEEAEDYLIATGQLSSLKDFIKYSFQALDLNWEDHVVVREDLYRPSEIAAGYGCPDKAKSKLNWSATTYMPEVAKKMTLSDFEELKMKKEKYF